MLKGREIVTTEDPIEWGEWMQASGGERHVFDDTVDGVRISTVFFGVDRNYASSHGR